MSRRIQWYTRSAYSHVSLLFTDTLREWEAWDRGGCGWREVFGQKHTAGTVVDLFGWPLTTKKDVEAVRQACDENDGADYDFPGLAGFVLRRNTQRASAWFCSEALIDFGLRTTLPLLRPEGGRAALVTPGQVTWSPVLPRPGIGRVVTGDMAMLHDVLKRYQEN